MWLYTVLHICIHTAPIASVTSDSVLQVSWSFKRSNICEIENFYRGTSCTWPFNTITLIMTANKIQQSYTQNIYNEYLYINSTIRCSTYTDTINVSLTIFKILDVKRIFGLPFEKRFALCCLSCLSVCPVCDVAILGPNSWADQDETWHAGRPRPWPHCVRWGPSSRSPKEAQAPNLQPISVAAKWLHGSRCHLVWR